MSPSYEASGSDPVAGNVTHLECTKYLMLLMVNNSFLKLLLQPPGSEFQQHARSVIALVQILLG